MSQFAGLPDLTGITKTVYERGEVPIEVYKDQPLMGMIKKDYTMGGASFNEPLIYSDVANTSATFSTAMAGTTQYRNLQWALTPSAKYNVGSISTLAQLSARGNETSFIDAYVSLVDRVRSGLQRVIALNMFRKSTGTVAQLSSTQTVSSTTATLANSANITALDLDLSIAFSATDGGAAKSGTAYITQINRANGTFQCSATLGGTAAALNSLVSTIAASDYIYRSAGDINLWFPGMSDWLIGSSVSSSDSFYGVNRSTDVSRLAGNYFDGSQLNIEDCLISAANLANQEGANPDALFVNANGYSQLEKMFVSRVIYPAGQFYDPNKPEFGYERFRISGGLSGMTVFLDNTVPDGYAFMLNMSTWKLKSVGPLISLYDMDGSPAKRSDTVDGMTFRLFSYPVLCCNAPGQNVRILLPTN